MIRQRSELAANVVRDAGGRVVGRTRLQKIAYLLEAAGLGEGFSFQYRHYGPYSEDLASATREGSLFGILAETEYAAAWGGTYSIFVAPGTCTSVPAARQELAAIANDADPVELELAATAVYLTKEEGYANGWAETARRKPDKAEKGRIERAKALYARLRQIETPEPLPLIS